jgi:hypothetical protein
MTPKKTRRDGRNEAALPFDVTQDIDPALAEDLRRLSEQTLTQTDFDDITLVLPESRKPRP